MWDLIVSVPDHCLSFYFGRKTRPEVNINNVKMGILFRNTVIATNIKIIVFIQMFVCSLSIYTHRSVIILMERHLQLAILKYVHNDCCLFLRFEDIWTSHQYHSLSHRNIK